MPTDVGTGYGSTRPRIKGTDPRLSPLVDQIGRGYRPTGRDRMTADMQAEVAGRRPSDADINDDFARRLAQQFPDDSQVRPGYRQFTHETDARNLESIRREGIRPSTGGSNFGDERPQVYGSRANSVENIPEGRVRVRYQVPEKDIIGRGSTGRYPSDTVSSRGEVAPGNIMSGYGHGGRIFDAGTSAGLLSLVGQAAHYIPGFAQRFPRTDWLMQGGPMGDLMNYVINQNYAPGGVMDPYKDWEPAGQTGGTVLA